MKKKLFKLQSELIKLQATAIDKIHGDIVEHKYGNEQMDSAMENRKYFPNSHCFSTAL